MHRLSLQIYLTSAGILLLFGLLAVTMAILHGWAPREQRVLRGAGELAEQLLPGSEAPPEAVQRALEQLAEALGLEAAVFDARGRPTAASHAGRPVPPSELEHPGWAGRGGPTIAVPLSGGRRLLLRRHHHLAIELVVTLALLAIACVIGAYPLVRRTTRRLERLQAQVQALGAGDLEARVTVEGRDEVAELARSFNRSAERIAQLVDSQRQMLAMASHELRSPLARMRVAVELLDRQDPEPVQERIRREIAGLDELVEELLLARRLEVQPTLQDREPVDLLALAAEVAGPFGAKVSGDPTIVEGHPRMLRRLVRNLLENAARYAAGSSIEAVVEAADTGTVSLRVLDRGPGVPDGERERVFEPFYRLAGRAAPGTGLGLALVRSIARHHGGAARCLPRDGGGSCFEVTLPAHCGSSSVRG